MKRIDLWDGWYRDSAVKKTWIGRFSFRQSGLNTRVTNLDTGDVFILCFGSRWTCEEAS